MTPLRALDLRTQDGVGILSDEASTYADGAESRVYEIVRHAKDLGSDSEELERLSEDWAERYHLCRQRSNVFRFLDLDPRSTILEVGSGCGAITRFLGERASTVDALEPRFARARVAASRTRDLQSVSVFCGGVAAVPEGRVYDVIVVCGVLEYVGAGSSHQYDEQRKFLQQLRDLLAAGGVMVVAIENQLGVKYLAGAPEDHSGTPFDGVIGYPGNPVARTYSRRSLERMFQDVGLSTRIIGAFPDYKLCQTLLFDALYEHETADVLAHRLPKLPSPDWHHAGERVLPEALLWRTLTTAGLGAHLSNSFVLTATVGTEQPLWSSNALAICISNHRRNEFSTITEVVEDRSAVRFRRTHLYQPHRWSTRSLEATLRHEVHSSEWVDGEDFGEAFMRADGSGRQRLLRSWLSLLAGDRHHSSDEVAVDLIPTNLIVDDESQLHVIDQEWFDSAADKSLIKVRGLAYLAAWLNARGHEFTVPQLATLADASIDDADIEALLRYETQLQCFVNGMDSGDTASVRQNVIRTFGPRSIGVALEPPGDDNGSTPLVRSAARIRQAMRSLTVRSIRSRHGAHR